MKASFQSNRVFYQKYFIAILAKIFIGPVRSILNESHSNMNELLITAVVNGSLEEVQALLASGLDVDEIVSAGVQLPHSFTLLMYAVWTNNLEMTQLLIRNGADVNRICGGVYVLDEALFPSGRDPQEVNLEMVQLLLDCGANVNYNLPLLGETLISLSIRHYWGLPSSTALLNKFISSGAYLDVLFFSHTSLGWAVLHGSLEAVKILIRAGANPICVTFEGWSLLQYAIKLNRQDIVDWVSGGMGMGDNMD